MATASTTWSSWSAGSSCRSRSCRQVSSRARPGATRSTPPIVAGIEINEVDKQAFVDASGPIYDEFGSKVAGAKEMIDQIQALAK